jgi:hypothetical protein
MELENTKNEIDNHHIHIVGSSVYDQLHVPSIR